jgi:hypothetical protein
MKPSRIITGMLAAFNFLVAGGIFLGPTTFVGRPAQLAVVVVCLLVGARLQMDLIQEASNASTTRD